VTTPNVRLLSWSARIRIVTQQLDKILHVGRHILCGQGHQEKITCLTRTLEYVNSWVHIIHTEAWSSFYVKLFLLCN